jgi:tetratricopeptide (TPR) repeat protein
MIPYLQSLFFDFVNFDDEGYVTENTLTISGFTFDSLSRVAVEFHMGNWHPLTMLTYMLEYSLFGPSPGVYHFTNVILHVATTYVLFAWLREATNSPWRSFVVALLFGVHPLRAESVVWISERKDVLCGLFWMLSLRAYSRYARERSRKDYGAVCEYAALCLLSKPMAVTLPCVMLLLDYWPLMRWQPSFPAWFPRIALSRSAEITESTATEEELSVWKSSAIQLFLEKWLLFAMAAVVAIVTINAQSRAMLTLDASPIVERIQTPLIGTVLYLDKTLRPIALAPFYPRPSTGLSLAFAGFCGTLILLLSGVAIAEMRRWPHLFVGWFWFVGVLFPVSGVLQTGTQLMADRYSYLPSIGLLIAAVWSFPNLESKLGRRFVEIGVVVVLVVLEFLTAIQVSHWKGTIPLFEHTLAVTKDNVMAHDMLGTAYFRNGLTDAARQQYESSLKIEPTNIPSLAHLALLAEKEGNMSLAMKLRLQAYEVDKSSPDSGVTLARFLDRRGDRHGAIQMLEEVLQKYPRSTQALIDLGFLHNELKQYELAIEYYGRAIAIDPKSSSAHMSMGDLLTKQGKSKEAIPHFETALRFNPGLYVAHFSLARIYFEQSDLTRARQNLRGCLAINPNFMPAKQLAIQLNR